MNKLNYIVFVFLVSSCASLTGPEGAFPDTKYDFLDEIIRDVVTTDDLELIQRRIITQLTLLQRILSSKKFQSLDKFFQQVEQVKFNLEDWVNYFGFMLKLFLQQPGQ